MARSKRDLICFMRRPHRHPETAQLLRARHGDRVVEIAGRSEVEVAEILKAAKVFVWRGNDKDGSPRPPQEALAAGCVVVALENELHADNGIEFGVRCSTEAELVERAGECLHAPLPSPEERALVRDKSAELRDWQDLVQSL